MFSRSTIRRSTVAVALAAAIVSGTTGCGSSATQTGTAPTSAVQAAATTAPATTAPSTSAVDTAAGADASAAAAAPVDPGDQSVDGPQLAKEVSDELTKQVGQAPDSVTCPDLPAKVGASVRCELKVAPDTYGVTVTTTSVQGTNVAFGIKVDDRPS